MSTNIKRIILLVMLTILAGQFSPVSAQLGKLTVPAAANPDLTTLIESFINFAITSGVVVFFIMFMWGAIEWLISEGEKGRLAQARGRMTSAAIGLILLGSAYAILSIVKGLTYTP